MKISFGKRSFTNKMEARHNQVFLVLRKTTTRGVTNNRIVKTPGKEPGAASDVVVVVVVEVSGVVSFVVVGGVVLGVVVVGSVEGIVGVVVVGVVVVVMMVDVSMIKRIVATPMFPASSIATIVILYDPSARPAITLPLG